jgi:hypothetical protein
MEFESPYWVGWAAGSWGVSWGYDDTDNPIEVYDGKLEPGGHWKHLFNRAWGCDAPKVCGKGTVTWSLKVPDVLHRCETDSQAPSVCGRVQSRGCVEPPCAGAVSVQVSEHCGSSFRVVAPRGCARAPFSRLRVATSGHVRAPFTGIHVDAPKHKTWVVFNINPPKCIKNPSPDELLALLY